MAAERPTSIPELDAFPDLEKLDDASKALCLVVTTFLDDTLQPLDALYTNLEPCRLLLARNDDLYTSLKDSHASRAYALRAFDTVRHNGALHRQKNSVSISQLLDGFLPGLVEFIDEGGPPAWSLDPDSDIIPEEDVKAHIASLAIPDVDGVPCVLLRDLGKFSEDAALAHRVNNIFVKGHHTFLVNTSGSGKTRLTFEGLCQHWGFYIAGAVDGSNNIGSGDLNQLLELHISRQRTTSYHPDALPPQSSLNVAENINVTHQNLRRMLLCRLLVFSMFADHIHAIGVTAAHKKIWLLVQTLIRTFGRKYDIFYTLLLELADTEDLYICDYIAHLLGKLRKSFGDDFHLFFVVDEAQAIFRYHDRAFRDGNGAYYPVLREILDGLDGEFRSDEVSFVAAGTQIPKSGFQNSRNVGRHRWCSDTGAFDDEGAHHAYVSRFLPPSYLETKAGEAFVRLVWAWCRGRYRFTDTLLATLARDGFRSPHRLLNAYIYAGTDYRPENNLEFVQLESAKEHADIRITTIDCETLESPLCATSALTLRNILLHYSVTGRHPQPFGADQIELVDLAFGRFIDGQMSQIVVDEPIMLIAAAHWFFNHAHTDPPRASLLDILQLRPATTSQPLLMSLVIYITHAFAQGHLVSKVFSFPHSAVPVWAKQKAEVVKLCRLQEEVQDTATDFSSGVLAATSQTSQDLLSWLEYEDLPPFCLPHPDGTDLVCVLRLADGTFIRIVLRASATENVLRDSTLKEVLRGLNDKNLFRREAEDSGDFTRALAAFHTLPPPSPKARRLPVLRVVASFPAPTYLSTATNKNTRGVASLNLGLFKTLSAAIPASVIFGKIVDAFAGEKRKRSVDSESTVESTGERTSKKQRVLPEKRRSRRLAV
ncbi:hypothetical protein C8F04DRAFT_1112758 [Mycena alexandri]|uniref:Uncharacterized protein n=1 Tax=Mycena alexandri TaxID=1745969 RepID=A0AAD6SMM3_9AGAR|nr:hypothetical protein C8F04DRAFT_1112758 [Mycena alexandri]